MFDLSSRKVVQHRTKFYRYKILLFCQWFPLLVHSTPLSLHFLISQTLFSLTMFWAHIFIITKYTQVSKEKRKARKWNTVSGTNSFHSHTLSFFILFHSSIQLFLSIDNNTLHLKRRKVREKRRKHFHGKAKTRKEPLETYLYAFRFLFFRNSFPTLIERKGRERGRCRIELLHSRGNQVLWTWRASVERKRTSPGKTDSSAE